MAENPAIVTAVRRCDQVYFEQVSQRQTLACGYAYTNGRHPSLPECNFIGEVLLDADTPDPLSVVEEHFGACGSVCDKWAPAAVQPAEPVARLLAPLGFERRECVVYGYEPQRPPSPEGRLRILSARAMRRAYTAMVHARAAPHAAHAEALAEIQLERLNDPQYDAFVGLDGDAPVAMGALMQVGAIGRVCDLYVAPEARGRGFGREMLASLLQTALRWALHPVCARAAAQDAAAAALLESAELRACGRIATFVRPGFFEVGG